MKRGIGDAVACPTGGRRMEKASPEKPGKTEGFMKLSAPEGKSGVSFLSCFFVSVFPSGALYTVFVLSGRSIYI